MSGEVLAVRYGTRTTSHAESYLNWHVYGEADAAFGMDYFFWVIRDATGAVTLLDCGFAPDVGRRRNRELLVDPVTALGALGIDPAAVTGWSSATRTTTTSATSTGSRPPRW